MIFGINETLFAVIVIIFAIWEIIWKGIALWKSARNNQQVWYIFILVLNTVGILPIIYILFFQEDRNKKK